MIYSHPMGQACASKLSTELSKKVGYMIVPAQPDRSRPEKPRLRRAGWGARRAWVRSLRARRAAGEAARGWP